jgi:hypothetical protein
MTEQRNSSAAAPDPLESTPPHTQRRTAQIFQCTSPNSQPNTKQQTIDPNPESENRKRKQLPDAPQSPRNAKRIPTTKGTIESSFVTVGASESESHNPSNSNPRPKCFRISGVPSTWSEDDLFDALLTIDPSLARQNYRPSLYPACCSSTQIALLNLGPCTQHLHQQNHLLVSESADRTAALLTIDSHFSNLTPLNVPEGEVVAELVFVYACRKYIQTLIEL